MTLQVGKCLLLIGRSKEHVWVRSHFPLFSFKAGWPDKTLYSSRWTTTLWCGCWSLLVKTIRGTPNRSTCVGWVSKRMLLKFIFLATGFLHTWDFGKGLPCWRKSQPYQSLRAGDFDCSCTVMSLWMISFWTVVGLDCLTNSIVFSSDDWYSEDSWAKCDAIYRAVLPPCIDTPRLPSPVAGGLLFPTGLPDPPNPTFSTLRATRWYFSLCPQPNPCIEW